MSFDYTCAVSNLPIGFGDKVRFCLLQASPYTNADEVWYLRAPPIRAQYNGYGAVEHIDSDDQSIAQLWLDGLKVDMIEKGVGDNTCHDVAVRNSMTFDELREALWEHRVEVRRELDPDRHAKFVKLLSKFNKTTELGFGIPSIERIEEIIKNSSDIQVKVEGDILRTVEGVEVKLSYKKQDDTIDYYVKDKFKSLWKHLEDDQYTLPICTLGTDNGQLIVDEIHLGEIRVRVGGYAGFEESLVYLNPLLEKLQKDYAAIITCGSGRYSSCAEISIKPKAGTLASGGKYLFTLNSHSSDKPQTVQVRACMIREDVWQSLLSMVVNGWTKDYKTICRKVEEYRVDAKKAWDEFSKNFIKKENRTNLSEELQETGDDITLYGWKLWWYDSCNSVGSLVCENPSFFGFGMNTSWAFMVNSFPPQKEINNFLNVIAETALVSDILKTVRVKWRPENTISPQNGEWKVHRNFHHSILKCTIEKINE